MCLDEDFVYDGPRPLAVVHTAGLCSAPYIKMASHVVVHNYLQGAFARLHTSAPITILSPWRGTYTPSVPSQHIYSPLDPSHYRGRDLYYDVPGPSAGQYLSASYWQKLYTPVREALAGAYGAVLPDTVHTSGRDWPTYSEWLSTFTDIQKGLGLRSLSLVPDRLSDCDIVSGSPVSGVAVIINFRNQRDKILRAVRSVWPWPVVITDDASTDGSLQVLLEYFSHGDHRHCLVRNSTRLRSARNLWRAFHLLTTGDGPLLELDGDDYYVPGAVDRVLQEYYKGFDRTLGSFTTVPDHPIRSFNSLRGTDPWSWSSTSTWTPLRSVLRSKACSLPLEYFHDIDGQWLSAADDAVIGAGLMEICRTSFIDDVLYVYDLSGVRDQQDWSPHYTHSKIPFPVRY